MADKSERDAHADEPVAVGHGGGAGMVGLFEDEDVVDAFFSPQRGPATSGGPARRLGAGKARPTHYRVVSVSLYTDDQQRLELLVRELKRRGHTRANRSLVIREALRQINLDRIPPQL